MQNQHFDIAGPNPMPEELRLMDERYIVYLDDLRRSAIAAAFVEKQRQQTQADSENDLARASGWLRRVKASSPGRR